MKINIKRPELKLFYLSHRLLTNEEEIAKDAEESYGYAMYIINGRFELGEEAISKDAVLAYNYAKDIIKGPWPKGEAVIARRNLEKPK